MSFHFTKAHELLALCDTHGLGVSAVTLRREVEETGTEEAVVLDRMLRYFVLMRESVKKGLEIKGLSPSGLSGGDAGKLYAYSQGEAPLFGSQFAKTIAYGFAVLETNAAFGRIVATPTAGSAGIVPACLLSLSETHGLDDEAAARALFTAAGIGHIIGANACFSGAQGGCQAEVGSASSMAAAAIVEAVGGTPEQTVNAAAFALMNTLGLVCDPIGGYVEVPCVSRNGMYAVHSFLAATMALANARCVVPFDDVVIAMRDIGRRMPRALKETAEGGLAVTPTGLRFAPAPAAARKPKQHES
ncbi:MAG TPA: L-serine ammonia-lyase, iron-sulfur-dependent, subunit alpha [Chthoniobacteraceae bacterium]|nr:L-serine ammonia-lyase, iron-sulfur-dependent, subunit alpha [Chthoniobacteraceae bacterium]